MNEQFIEEFIAQAIHRIDENTPKIVACMKDQVGSIEAGKLADIVAVDGDPLKDPKVFGKVVFVMKNGDVYKQ